MISLKRSSQSISFVFEKDGKEKEYKIQELPPEFVAWNLGERIFALEKKLENVGNPNPHKGGKNFGSHLPVIITNNPENSLFPFNAANKGTGFVAKDEYLDFYLEKFEKVYKQTDVGENAPEDEKNNAIKKRISTILDFYKDTKKIDLRVLAGLEIWPGHTTQNFFRDPRVSLHFLGMPTPNQKVMRYNQWQVNCIWEKIEPTDKRFKFGVSLRSLTLGHIGKSFVPGHIPVEKTPIKGHHPFGWNLWVVETLDKGIQPMHS